MKINTEIDGTNAQHSMRYELMTGVLAIFVARLKVPLFLGQSKLVYFGVILGNSSKIESLMLLNIVVLLNINVYIGVFVTYTYVIVKIKDN